jgi:hypothetical protein
MVPKRISTVDTQALKELIKESVREVLREEWFSLYQMLIPFVSDAEQNDIDQELGSPSNVTEDDFVDMTDWVDHVDELDIKKRKEIGKAF